MAALVIMGVGALAAAGGQIASGVAAGNAAQKQAQAQKRAATRYAKALRSEASKLQGGMSAAQKRTLKTEAALDRAALGQQARDEAKRGGQSPSAALESELQASLQASMAEQQKMIDQLSTQEAQAKAAQRQALKGQALQTEMQAQAIDPKAIKQATMAPMYGQVAGTLGGTAIQAASPTAATQLSGMVGQQVTNRNLDYKAAIDAGTAYNDLSPSDQLTHARVQSLMEGPQYNYGSK
jgi:chromosome segregation ATPase